MKELGMSLEEIKSTPRHELEGLLRALSNFNTIHAFEGQSQKSINELAKDNPDVRADYNKHVAMKEKYDILVGRKKQHKSFSAAFGIK
tara:strand:- start:28 stop:291 length:264 start_codon:yes stop_codon:yes gene_type:complete